MEEIKARNLLYRKASKIETVSDDSGRSRPTMSSLGCLGADDGGVILTLTVFHCYALHENCNLMLTS